MIFPAGGGDFEKREPISGGDLRLRAEPREIDCVGVTDCLDCLDSKTDCRRQFTDLGSGLGQLDVLREPFT